MKRKIPYWWIVNYLIRVKYGTKMDRRVIRQQFILNKSGFSDVWW